MVLIELRCTGTSYQCHDMDPDCHQNLTICSLAHCPTFPENLMQIRLEVFAQSCLQTDRQIMTTT